MDILNFIRPNSSIVILTGAGISAESGIRTFRGDDGLWEGHRLEDVATPEAYRRNPALVQEFYNMRRRGLLDEKVQPNAAHFALAELEKKWAGDVLLVTQNIDDLHERAGSENLVHMHGELLKMFCVHCAVLCGNEAVQKFDVRDDLSVGHVCGVCQKPGGVRPDIVWFGEMPYQMDRIFAALLECDLFLSIGTSGNVYPAAGFVAQARSGGAQAAELNLEPSLGVSHFHDGIYGPAGRVVPEFVERLLSAD